jgi:cystathionine beta-lyase
VGLCCRPFGAADLLPFTISDMDFATAPCITEALHQRINHGVFGYSRWKNDEFLAAVAHWFQQRFNSRIDTESIVYGPSVIYMVSELIRIWSDAGDGVVVHTPAYDAFTMPSTAISALWCPWRWRKMPQAGRAIWLHWKLLWPGRKTKSCCCAARRTTGKVWTREELHNMAELCARYDVAVISDEIHMDMVWGEHRHTPWNEVALGKWALLTSGSKSFNIPALTGAYGLIGDDDSRNAYLSAERPRWAIFPFRAGADRAHCGL